MSVPTTEPKDYIVCEAFMKYVGRLITEVGQQHRANRIKNRKLRALRKALRMYRDMK